MSNKFLSAFSFVIFWLVAFGFYHSTAGAGFVTDEVGWLKAYNFIGWKGIFNAFGDKSLHYGYHIVAFTAWKFFHLDGMRWMLLFVTLHALNTTVSFLVFRNFFSLAGIKKATHVAFVGSFLFLISPYQTESMVWYACIHYLVCTFLLLLAMYHVLLYLNSPKKKFIVLFYFSFTAALFTLEISFTFPVILLLLFFFAGNNLNKKTSAISLIKIFVLPAFALLPIYFLMSKFLKGSVVGHYGAAEHLRFSIPLLMGNLSKYFVKIFFLFQFVAYEKRLPVYLFFEKAKYGWLLFLVLLSTTVLFLSLRGKLKKECKVAIVLFTVFIVALLPVLNLFFSYIVNIEGDRFTYFASLFAYQLMAMIVFALFKKWSWLPFAFIIFFQIKFLQANTASWTDAGKTEVSLLQSFKWFNADKVFLLNTPDNMNGAYMFRAFPPDNSFAETLELTAGKKLTGKISDVLQCNMLSKEDSVTVEKISANQLKISFTKWGNWWWSRGIGASSYADKNFSVDIDAWNHSYILTVKNKIPNSVFVYQCGGVWKEVKDF